MNKINDFKNGIELAMHLACTRNLKYGHLHV